ncbi:polymer-forming cytoskeletal protein [Ramlibacter sp. AW1]|uniref:Polymer-forming cytoskeletal protein n=1 Tax=Ramlibacter aurantiacus TaxID=2801330 RepID=A0A936ZQP1_9BURK|nr:polymer-forming cytoskeletal protein [Ramlibacter aurantiacus]MBL0421713.1 polymer-forming cytoskeletal protein [Ramlibacter aurantiacus]
MFGKKAQPPIKSLLAQGCRIEGHLLFNEGLRIDGEVVGDIRGMAEQPSLLVVSETAIVDGEIVADHVIVNGTVRGPVHATELLELQPRARVEGDVSYGSLEIHQGAVLTGQLRHLPPAEEKPLLKLAANNA